MPKKTEKVKLKDYKKMPDKALLRYYEGLKFTNQHLKELHALGKLKNNKTLIWAEVFKQRNKYLEKVRIEILTRMEK